jgi:hypothetical protein
MPKAPENAAAPDAAKPDSPPKYRPIPRDVLNAIAAASSAEEERPEHSDAFTPTPSDGTATPVVAGTLNKEAALREFIRSRIGPEGLSAMLAYGHEVGKKLDEWLGIDQGGLPIPWPVAEKLDRSEAWELRDAISELVQAAFVQGHRTATGGTVLDDQHARERWQRVVEGARNTQRIRDEYDATANQGLTQAQRIAAVAKATGAARSTIYKAIRPA